MVVKIAVFNRFVDEDYLIKICKCKIISKIPCVSNKIRLRKINKTIHTFHVDEFKSTKVDSSYGMLYELEIDDLYVYSLYQGINSFCKNITVSTIKVNNVDDFMKNNYRIIKHDVKCMCFVLEKNDKTYRIYKNRKTSVNFNTKLLLNLLKI